MANKCGNLVKSAHPQSSKRKTCVQECLRRFKNTSRELPLSHIQDVIRDYMTELGHGGYSLQWRKEVLQDAVKGYTRIWQL